MSNVDGAMFTAGAAVFASLISLVAAFRSSARQQSSALAIEELKSRLTVEMERRKRRVEVIKTKLDELTKAISILQCIKDDISILSDSPYGVISPKESISLLEGHSNDLTTLYHEKFAAEYSNTSRILHETKRLVIDIKRMSVEYLCRKSRESVAMDSYEYKELSYLRSKMSHFQDELKIEHLKLLSSYLES